MNVTISTNAKKITADAEQKCPAISGNILSKEIYLKNKE